MESLDLYNLKISIYENVLPDDSVIQRIISGHDAKDAILIVLMKYGFITNSNLSYEDKSKYFYNLCRQIKYVSGFNYSNDDLEIYTMYATPFNFTDYKDMNQLKMLTAIFENIFNLSPTGENEMYISELVKYKLLHLYSEQIDTGRYTDMKKLLNSLNDNRDNYNALRDKITNKIK